MDGPGLSLFQGGDSIRLNNSNQREEDEDFLEEEKIRKAEVNIYIFLGCIIKYIISAIKDHRNPLQCLIYSVVM